LCSKCLNSIKLKSNFECIGCKRPFPKGMTCYLCVKTYHVDQLLIAADFEDKLVEKSIKLMKYNFIFDLAAPLSLLVNRYLKHLAKEKSINIFESNPILIPVPLHKRRFNWRGFNQAELLAKNIAGNFLMSIFNDVIYKTKIIKPQAITEDREERMQNVIGAFECRGHDRIDGKDIILIDDVCTTGATLNECARVLKENGARKVIALVVARG